MVQSNVFDFIKKIIPGFIQGMTKKEMEKSIHSRINANMKSISIDGSAFDSSQYSELMEAVDNKFWKRLEPFLVRSFIKSGFDNADLYAKLVIREA